MKVTDEREARSDDDPWKPGDVVVTRYGAVLMRIEPVRGLRTDGPLAWVQVGGINNGEAGLCGRVWAATVNGIDEAERVEARVVLSGWRRE